MSKPITVEVLADTSDLQVNLGSAESKLQDFQDTAEESTRNVADSIDTAGGNFAKLGGAVGDLAGGFEAVGLGGFGEQLNKLSPLLMFAAGAADVFTVANEALNLTFLSNPITLVVLAIVALVAIFVVAYKKSDAFREIVNNAFEQIKGAAESVVGFFTEKVPAAFDAVVGVAKSTLDWVKEHWPLILAILTGPFGLAVLAIAKKWDAIKAGASAVKDFIVDKFNAVVSFVKGLPDRIADATLGMFDGIKDAFKGALNFVIDGWNSVSFTLPEVDTHIPGVGKVGGWELSTPDIPRLATGGRADRPSLVVIGDGTEPESVMPDGMFERALTRAAAAGAAMGGGRGGGGTHIHIGTITAHDYQDFERQIARQKRRASSDGVRRL